MMDHLSPERVAEIVARLMPIGGETEERRLLTLDVRATEQAAVKPERERCAGIADAHMGACDHGSLASGMGEDAGASAVLAIANDETMDDLSRERVAQLVARLMPIGGETEEHRVCISALSMGPRRMPLNADLAGSLSAR